MQTLYVILLLGLSMRLTLAKVHTKCTLLSELKRLHIAEREFQDWICVAQYAGHFNTRAMITNSNKSKDWGIFQINDHYWCDPQDGRSSKNLCKVACRDLIEDDIMKALKCARTIKSQYKGFNAWVVWNHHCQKTKPDLSSC